MVATPFGKVRVLPVLPVHLEYRDESTCQASMDILNRVAGGETGMPVLVLGDFNTENVFVGSDVLMVSSGKRLSFPSDPSESPRSGIDWIFRNGKVEILDVRLFGGCVVGSPWGSCEDSLFYELKRSLVRGLICAYDWAKARTTLCSDLFL
jgi:hypothetical protein